MSTTACFYPIVSAFVTAEKEFLGPNRIWTPKNEMQKRFLKDIPGSCRSEVANIPEIRNWAAKNAESLNAVLRQEGFDIQLEKFPVLPPPLYAWGAVSILKLLSKWLVPGTKTEVQTLQRETFPAAKLKEDGVTFFRVRGHKYPIACIRTEAKDVYCLTMYEEGEQQKHFDLLAKAEELSIERGRVSDDFSGLIFPMVSLDQKVDITWLKDMSTIDSEGFPNVITQALQQTRLKMNHLGAKVESAVAIGGMRFTSVVRWKEPHVINKPFLVWVERPGLTHPLFVGHITKEDWKDPGDFQ